MNKDLMLKVLSVVLAAASGVVALAVSQNDIEKEVERKVSDAMKKIQNEEDEEDTE